jgi:dTDP-4-dehydrorhamnose 3,5-epimerase
MIVEPTLIEGAYSITPNIFGDDRGFFYESYNKEKWSAAGLPVIDFVQDNHSRSARGVLRGLHYQSSPKAQAKLVRCTRGRIFDVAVDIRPQSLSYLKWIGVELSEDNKKQLFIPAGCLHGFYTLEDADVLYKTNFHYDKALDGSIMFNDPTFGVQWPFEGGVILSQKDATAPFFHTIKNPFAV